RRPQLRVPDTSSETYPGCARRWGVRGARSGKFASVGAVLRARDRSGPGGTLLGGNAVARLGERRAAVELRLDLGVGFVRGPAHQGGHDQVGNKAGNDLVGVR